MTKVTGILSLLSSRPDSTTYHEEAHAVEAATMTGATISSYPASVSPGGTLTNVTLVEFYFKVSGKLSLVATDTAATFEYAPASWAAFAADYLAASGTAAVSPQTVTIAAKVIDSDHVTWAEDDWVFQSA
jgi:hypothetical protein